MKTIKVNSYSNLPRNFTGVVEFLSGTKEWLKEGKLHKIDGPAATYSNGNKEWWIEGKRHRIDGPAVEYPDGDKFWYVENRLYSPNWLRSLTETSIFLEKKQKGKYNLDWLRFLTDEGIKEFPIIPGMESYGEFPLLFNQLFGVPIK